LGQPWYPGYNIMTAIGQNNLFTPVQLGVYAATLANGGVRYRAHYVKSVKTQTSYEAVLDNGAEIISQANFSPATVATVHEAMRKVASLGGHTGRAFQHLDVKVAGKTGTSQVVRQGQRGNNGFFISFAPYEAPEIAVAVCGEGFTSAIPLAPVAARIYEYYFAAHGAVQPPQGENVALG
jgi:penicillin-binding protein 2